MKNWFDAGTAHLHPVLLTANISEQYRLLGFLLVLNPQYCIIRIVLWMANSILVHIK